MVDWTAVAIATTLFGWLVNNHFQRKHQIERQRFDRRMAALQAFIPVLFSFEKSSQPFIDDPALSDKLRDLRVAFHFYEAE